MKFGRASVFHIGSNLVCPPYELSYTHTTRVAAVFELSVINESTHIYVRRRASTRVQNAEIESGSNSASYCVRLEDADSNHQSHRTTVSRGTLHIHNLNVPCAAEVNFVHRRNLRG